MSANRRGPFDDQFELGLIPSGDLAGSTFMRREYQRWVEAGGKVRLSALISHPVTTLADAMVGDAAHFALLAARARRLEALNAQLLTAARLMVSILDGGPDPSEKEIADAIEFTEGIIEVAEKLP